MTRKHQRPPSGMENAFDPEFDNSDAKTHDAEPTADTLTDEQILNLRADAIRRRAAARGDVMTSPYTAVIEACHDALPGAMKWQPVSDWGESRPVTNAERAEARARIAALLTARAKEG